MDYSWIWKSVIVILVITVVYSARYMWHLKDDNPLEEAGEQIISNVSGYNVDLTPLSLEKE